MKAGIAIQNPYPDDSEVRTRKIAKSLNNRGHTSVVYARTGETEGEPNYTDVRRFEWFSSISVIRYITMPLPFNPFWVLWMLINFAKDDVDVVIASNIRAGVPAVIASKVLRIPIVLDLQENNPEVVKLRSNHNLVHYVTRNSTIVDLIERFCIRMSDMTWVVVDERKKGLIKRGVPENKIKVISNTPYILEYDNLKNMDSNCSWDWFTLVYLGAITNYRGLEKIIRALPYTEDVGFVIAGDGPYVSELKSLVNHLGIEERVIFLGWIDTEDAPAFLKSGDLGVIPHDVNRFTNTTIPNKLFDYMTVGLPVLATRMKPVHRIISETKCGQTVSRNVLPSDIAEAIIQMKKHEDMDQLGVNGQKSIIEKYNWEEEFDKALLSLEYLVGK